jgi:hypothetical protein
MIAAALFAAGLATAAPRYVVLRLRATVFGVAGTGTIALDRRTGRFARRLIAGPASVSEGWDGTRAWRADATGLGRVEGNAGERGEILAWSRVLVRALKAGRPQNVTVSSGRDHTALAFDRIGADRVPHRIVSTSTQDGTWSATVIGVATPAVLPPSAFAPRPAPHDASLAGITRVPASMRAGSPQIDVMVDGVRLRCYFDTGGQNVITAAAAARIGLHPVGTGIVRGGGGGTVPIRFAFAHTVRIGAATLRHQPFIVLPGSLFGVDGIVGYEVLARFAARLDMAHETLALAPRASAFGPAQHPLRFAYFDRQPQVAGALAGIRGPLTIDTGSSLNAEVQAGAVHRDGLARRWHARITADVADVGIRYPVYLVRVPALRLGPVVVPAPLVELQTHVDRTDDQPMLANVGDGILQRWIIVLDYRDQIVDLRAGGVVPSVLVRDHSGIVLAPAGGALIAGTVLGGTPAAAAGIVTGERILGIDGRAVTAADVVRVRTRLRGAPGTRVSLRLGDGTTRTFTLRRYL